MKDILGWEGIYAITSCGKVWSYKNKMFLRPQPDKEGYLTVMLTNKDRGRKNCKVHRLVAQAYIDNPEDKPQINHLDEDKTHNYTNNLAWATPKENANWGTRNIRQAEALKKRYRGEADV